MLSLLQCKFPFHKTPTISSRKYFLYSCFSLLTLNSPLEQSTCSKKIWNNILQFVLMQESFLNMNLITIHNNGKSRTDFNWNEIIGNMHRRSSICFFLSVRLQSVHDRNTIGKCAIDLFTFFHRPPFFRPTKVELFLCVVNIRNQSQFQNLFPVNSLNNLHHKARLTLCSPFL